MQNLPVAQTVWDRFIGMGLWVFLKSQSLSIINNDDDSGLSKHH